jgi:hypothetical protein
MIPSLSFAQADIGAGTPGSWPADTESEVAYNSNTLKSKFSGLMSMAKHKVHYGIVTRLPALVFLRYVSKLTALKRLSGESHHA